MEPLKMNILNLDDERMQIRKEHPYEIISKDGPFLQDQIPEKARTLVYKS